MEPGTSYLPPIFPKRTTKISMTPFPAIVGESTQEVAVSGPALLRRAKTGLPRSRRFAGERGTPIHLKNQKEAVLSGRLLDFDLAIFPNLVCL